MRLIVVCCVFSAASVVDVLGLLLLCVYMYMVCCLCFSLFVYCLFVGWCLCARVCCFICLSLLGCGCIVCLVLCCCFFVV